VSGRHFRHGKGAASAASFSAAEWLMQARFAGVSVYLGGDGSLVAMLHCFASDWSWPKWERLRQQARRNRAAILAMVSDRTAWGDAIACYEVIQ
jgi:hypothetical protein